MDTFETESCDYMPMSEFGMRYRWTEHIRLSPKKLARIKPLTVPKADEAWRRSSDFREPKAADGRPSALLWTEIEELAEPTDAAGADWLERRIDADESPIIVCWNRDTAIETDARMFARHWESFCYPSSDDVAVFPLHLGWLVTYWHEGHLFIGRRRPK